MFWGCSWRWGWTMWFKDKIQKGRAGQVKKYRNLLIWRAHSVDHQLSWKSVHLQDMMFNGGKASFCSRGSVGRNEGTTADRRSKGPLQQNCMLKQACHQKHSREKALYCLQNRNWKWVRGEILWLSCSLRWLDTALDDLWYFCCFILLQFCISEKLRLSSTVKLTRKLTVAGH